VRVTGFLIEKDGSAASADRETVQRLLEKGELLWLDLYRPDADELGMLATVFGIHQLAISDAAQFGQRPKLADYDDFTQPNLYDHLIRVSDLVDSYRDLLTGSMDAYLSTVSNRLNVVMKQLTVIATIFLPLSFITGFFGQNFAWLIGRIGGLGPFLVLGVGIELAIVAGMLLVFRRRGWL
jgi:Mg2+ and Co2+ transporter CorA